jgi:predicted NBD/HSP70 family sugar kinase
MVNNAANAAGMKLHNRRIVLNLIRKNPVSRADLAKKTGLTRAAVSLIVDELIQDRIVVESGPGESVSGRKPILLDLNRDTLYSLGVHIYREGTYAGVVDINGRLIAEEQITFEQAECGTDGIGDIVSACKRLMDSAEIGIRNCIGIGVSAPGPVDTVTGTILNPPNLDRWQNTDVVTDLKKQFGLPVVLENDASARTLAEKSYGRGGSFRNWLLLLAGAGIGGGIIVNERLYKGVNGFGNEIGHTTVQIDGEKCGCGNTGCLELYASISELLKQCRKSGKDVRAWKEIVDAAETDGWYKEVIRKEAGYLAAGIINIMNILELEAVILAGDITYKPELLLKSIKEIVYNRAITRNVRNYPIIMSDFADSRGIVSAASAAMERYFSPKE